jgi:hypothetical protein
MTNESTPNAPAPVQDMESSGTRQGMSIALVIGVTVGIIGLVILLTGVIGHPDFKRSDNINIDLWWGLLMIVFGILMTGGSLLMQRIKNK